MKKSNLQTTSTTITIRKKGGSQVVGWILATGNLKSHCFLSFSAEYSVNQLLRILQRNNEDCWLDDKLVCQDFELDFDINTDWFVSAFHGPRYGMTSRWCRITPFYSRTPSQLQALFQNPILPQVWRRLPGNNWCLSMWCWCVGRPATWVPGWAQVKEFSIQCRESQVYWQVKEPCNRFWDDCIAKHDSGFAFICDVSISYLKAEEDSHVWVNGYLSWRLQSQLLQCNM